MITLYFDTIDHSEWTEQMDTVEQAVSVIQYYLGTPEVGAAYAVSGDGIVTCYIEGATWKELGFGY